MKSIERQAEVVAREIMRDAEEGDELDFVDVAMCYETTFGVAIRAVELLYIQGYVEACEKRGLVSFVRTSKESFIRSRREENFKNFSVKEYFSIDNSLKERYNTHSDAE